MYVCGCVCVFVFYIAAQSLKGVRRGDLVELVIVDCGDCGCGAARPLVIAIKDVFDGWGFRWVWGQVGGVVVQRLFLRKQHRGEAFVELSVWRSVAIEV
jgi:hypothetical protein